MLMGAIYEYAFQKDSYDMTYLVRFMKIDLGLQVILRILRRQSEGLQCWYY
jgi:hypothetical protein